MKTQDELNELKNEVKTLEGKLSELTEEELTEVCGGATPNLPPTQLAMFAYASMQELAVGQRQSVADVKVEVGPGEMVEMVK